MISETTMFSQIGMTPDDYQELFAEKESLSVELENMSALMQVITDFIDFNHLLGPNKATRPLKGSP